MTQEQPLKGISKDIAKHLDVCPKVAAQILTEHKVPTFKLGRFTCCYASTLKKCLEGAYRYNDDPSTDPPVTSN